MLSFKRLLATRSFKRIQETQSFLLLSQQRLALGVEVTVLGKESLLSSSYHITGILLWVYSKQ